MRKSIGRFDGRKMQRFSVSLLVLVFCAVSLSSTVQAAPLYKIECRFEYRVRKGDTLSRIASRFGVKPVDIVRLNKIHKPYTIFVGESLCIPDKSKTGFKDINKAYANAKAGYFVASWDKKGLKVTSSNLGKKNSYYVKIDDPDDGVHRMVKIGMFPSGRKGNNTKIFKIPKFIRDADSLRVCLKNAQTDTLLCNVIWKWANQSYPNIQLAR